MIKKTNKYKKPTRKKKHDYVDNQKFLQELINYKKLVNKHKKNKLTRPKIPEYLGQCFLEISKNLSYTGNFINYSFRDDFISDGVENCIQYIDNFDPKISKNPFGYFTQIIAFAFIRRIKKEKKQIYIKYKSFELSKLSENEEYLKYMKKNNEELPSYKRDFIKSFENSFNKKKKNDV